MRVVKQRHDRNNVRFKGLSDMDFELNQKLTKTISTPNDPRMMKNIYWRSIFDRHLTPSLHNEPYAHKLKYVVVTYQMCV